MRREEQGKCFELEIFGINMKLLNYTNIDNLDAVKYYEFMIVNFV